MPNWIMPPTCVDSMMRTFTRQMAMAEFTNPQFFPDLRRNPDLVLASDYAGEHAESDYQVACYLLTNRAGVMDSWERGRLRVRDEYLFDGRRMAFKKLSDAERQRALVPFLKATAQMNGIVFCAAIDKSLMTSNFGYEFSAVSGAAKPLVLAKLTRIAVLGSILVGGLSASGQNVHWITDDDEIVGNDAVLADAGVVIGGMLHRNCPSSMDMPSIGVAGKFDDNLRAEDLCAIPDLVGGAMAENLNAMDKSSIPRETNLFTPVFKRVSTKATLILGWFASLNGPLKKLFCLVRGHSDGKILCSFSQPTILIDDPNVKTLWTPLDKGWRRSLTREF